MSADYSQTSGTLRDTAISCTLYAQTYVLATCGKLSLKFYIVCLVRACHGWNSTQNTCRPTPLVCYYHQKSYSIPYHTVNTWNSVVNPSFYYSVIRFQIFRVNRGTWLVNSRHVTQTQTSVYFGTDVLQWSCSTWASPPRSDDITEGITYVITRVSSKTYVILCFLCERAQAISVNPSSLKQCQKYTEPCHQLCHLCKFVSQGSFS